MKISESNLEIDGTEISVSIILPYFNDKLGTELLQNVEEELKILNVKNISVTRVSGTLELPFACKRIIERQESDVLIALGIVIRGETSHFDLVVETAHNGLMEVQLKNETPIIFGILACENLEQARKRVSKKELNKGKEFAQAAIIQAKI